MCEMQYGGSIEDSNKKKNKLGYHRQSIACSFCRRRKIRCIPAESHEGKCENCHKTGRECIFIKVAEDGSSGPTWRHEKSTQRSKSLCDIRLDEAELVNYASRLDSYHPQTIAMQPNEYFDSKSLQTDILQPPTDHPMVPWPLSGDARPSLLHRQSEPYPRSTYHVDPQVSRMNYPEMTAQWPIYDHRDSNASEQSSADGLTSHTPLTPWSNSESSFQGWTGNEKVPWPPVRYIPNSEYGDGY